MYTSALAGGVYRHRDKVYVRYLYTRNRMMMMTTTMTMTMLLTTVYTSGRYLQTKCPKTETIWKIHRYPRSYYLDLPDGQLMIGGSKVVGTLGRLDAELIADNKREKKLLGLSVILSPWGRPNQKEKAYYWTTVYSSLSPSFSFLLFCIKKEKNCWVVSSLSIIRRLVFSS